MTGSARPRGFAAVILAGGAASRLSGLDKPAIEVGGRSLLARSVAAVAGAEPVVVVGPRRDDRITSVPVRWTREHPPGSGPLAALAAGVAALPAALPEDTELAVLAADLAGIEPDTVTRLRAALAGAGTSAGAVLVDQTGSRQWLTGVWRLAAVRAALPADPAGRSVRSALGRLRLVEVTARRAEAADVDTPGDLRRLR